MHTASKRILLVAPPWFPVPPTGYGGIEQVVASLADGLADAGHDVTLLASGGSRTRARLVTVYEHAPSELLGDAATELAHVLAAHVDGRRYDVIHDHTLIGAALGAARGVTPVVHTLHGPWTDRMHAIYRRLGTRIHLVAISHDQARRAGGVRIAGVVPNGIDVDRHALVREKDTYLLFVGRASREKGPEVALDVARRLGRRLVMAIKVNEPAEREYWRDVVEPRLAGVDVDVRQQVGPAEKVALMARAAVLLFPIQWPEPFGLVPAEANASGTPVVAFAEGAATEVVADGVSGILVRPGDVDAMCRAVPLAAQLEPEACRRHVVDNYSAERMVAGYADIYRRVTSGRVNPGPAPAPMTG